MMTPPTETEIDLLPLAADGDRAALEGVARAWWPQIRRWCLYLLGNEALAEEASQEALIRLMRGLQEYDTSRPFAPWLKTLTRNVCHTLRQRDERHRKVPVEAPILDAEPSPEQRIDRQRSVHRAVRAFEDLPPRQRQVIAMCTLDGMSAADAARDLGIAPATARVLLHRARRTLRLALGEAP